MKSKKEYVEKKNVQFIGLDILNREDQEIIKGIIYSDFILLERELKNINSLRLHFKEYEKGGKKKYSVHLFIDAPTKPIVANKIASSVQWNPVQAVAKLMDKARKEITHKFKTDQTRQTKGGRRLFQRNI